MLAPLLSIASLSLGCASDPAASASGGATAPPPMESHKDLAYAQASPAEKLDLYLPVSPAARARPLPLVVWIHGGGFSSGDKGAEAADGGQHPAVDLVAAGYAVASLNYRLSTEAKFPAGVQDVKAAVRWLRAHAADYDLDPGRFAAWGESAVGYLVAILGVTGDQPTSFDDDALGNAGASSAVQAVVDWFGQTDFLQIDAQFQSSGACGTTWLAYDPPNSLASTWFGAPIQTIPAQVNAASVASFLPAAKALPPFDIVHGDADCEVPLAQSKELADALTKAGASVTLTVLPGAAHADPVFYSKRFPADIAFLDGVFGVQR